jgi:hypothetical protein
MKRIVPLVLFIACSTLIALAQPEASREGPRISLYLPRGFPSETVQIEYMLTGPFGGYGSFIRSQPDRQTLDFVAAVDGKPADNIKVIAYLPGCEIVKLEFVPAGTAAWRQLDCKPLGTTTLHGRVPAADATRNIDVTVSYEVEWAFDFFGIRDGIGFAIPLSTATTDENGQFAFDVPDFYKQNQGRGSYLVGFRCVDCTSQPDHGVRELPIAASYPPIIEFTSQ